MKDHVRGAWSSIRCIRGRGTTLNPVSSNGRALQFYFLEWGLEREQSGVDEWNNTVRLAKRSCVLKHLERTNE